MGNSLYFIENLRVFLRSSYHLLIYFKSVPKATKFIRPLPFRPATGPDANWGRVGTCWRGGTMLREY